MIVRNPVKRAAVAAVVVVEEDVVVAVATGPVTIVVKRVT